MRQKISLLCLMEVRIDMPRRVKSTDGAVNDVTESTCIERVLFLIDIINLIVTKNILIVVL